MAAATFVLYAAWTLRRHALFETSAYDLGIFGQGVRAYSGFHVPTSELRAPVETFHGAGFPLLGDHFSPVLALLGMFYRVTPDIRMLLVAQAALIAWSAHILTSAAQDALGRRAGVVIGAAYALSWGVVRMAGFDFHEVAFALPLLCLAARAYLDERWTACALWACSLILVKEDLGLTVFVFGLLLLRQRPARRLGLVLCVIGPIATALAVLVLVPHFNPQHVYGYLGGDASDGTGLSDLAKRPWKGLVMPFYPWEKLGTVAFVLLPTAFVAVRSRLVLLAVPMLLVRFAADNPYYWGTKYHYSATLMPVVFFALVEALPALPELRRRVVPATGVVAATAVVAAALLPFFGLGEVATPGFWHADPRVTAADRAVALVPAGTTVAATDAVAPHLVDRARVYLPKVAMFDPGSPRFDWIVVDVTATGFKHEDLAVAAEALACGYQRVFTARGYVVLRRDEGTREVC